MPDRHPSEPYFSVSGWPPRTPPALTRDIGGGEYNYFLVNLHFSARQLPNLFLLFYPDTVTNAWLGIPGHGASELHMQPSRRPRAWRLCGWAGL